MTFTILNESVGNYYISAECDIVWNGSQPSEAYKVEVYDERTQRVDRRVYGTRENIDKKFQYQVKKYRKIYE